MLNYTLDVCINWEPLHVNNGVVPKELNFGWVPFIPREQLNQTYISLFTNIHEFKLHSEWTIKNIRLKKLIQSKHILVKYVRANLLIPYFFEIFKFKYPPIFLIRHPLDTSLSHIKAFNKNNSSIKTEIPTCINNERFVKHNEFINQLETKLEIAIAIWCMNNCPTLDQINNYDLHILFYSDLLLNPRQELEFILSNYKFNAYSNRLNNIDFKKKEFYRFQE